MSCLLNRNSLLLEFEKLKKVFEKMKVYGIISSCFIDNSTKQLNILARHMALSRRGLLSAL